MAESSVEKPKALEKPKPALQSELQVGSIGHQASSGVGAGAPPPPLNSAAVSRIQRDPQHALRSDMLALQRTVGNRAVAALVRGETRNVAIQAKLEVGPVNDVYEQEADRIARMVTSDIAQRKPAANVKSHDDERESTSTPALGQPAPALNIKRMVVQRKSAESSVRADGSFTTDSSIQNRIRRMEAGGRPLPDTVRRQMEPRFGADFGNVRIHTGGEAVQLSRDIGARAFTHGSHIAFGASGFNPSSQDGRHLLAHELTHTIQQTGASPLPSVQRGVQRSPEGTIQRGILDRMKSFFSRSKPEAVVTEEVPGTPEKIQADAFAKITETKSQAETAVRYATTEATQKWSLMDRSHTSNLSGVMEVTKVKDFAAKDSPAARAKNSVFAGEMAVKKSVDRITEKLRDIKFKIYSSYTQVEAANELVGIRSGDNDIPGQRKIALRSHALAAEAEQLLESIRAQSKTVGTDIDREGNMALAGLEKNRVGGYEARSIAAAEKSASDSAMDLMGFKSKVEGYIEYFAMDLEVLKNYMITKGAEVTQKYSSNAAIRAMGSGVQREELGANPEDMDTISAYNVSGGINNAVGGTDGDGLTEEETIKQREKDYEAGKKEGANTVAVAQKKQPQITPPKPLSKGKVKFAEEIKSLEITSLLYERAKKRIPKAQAHAEKVSKYHDDAMALYETINQDRDTLDSPTPEQIDKSIKDAADARAKVAWGAIEMTAMYQMKREVYDESQKYEKLVGERAMSSGKRKLKKLGGIIANAGTRAFTGGLVGYAAEDEAGGYRVGLKSRTIFDDITRKNFELEQIVGGLGPGMNVRGLGGENGAYRYAYFKAVSFALQVVRDIASAIALWITLLSIGTAAPVGAVFASIALFAALAKGAIDLVLLVWSGVGLANTNDPRSRSILRAENVRQGLALGEAAFAGASAGTIMDISGNQGLATASVQGKAFGGGDFVSTLGNVAVGPGIPAVGNLAQNVGMNNLSHYTPQLGAETGKGNKVVEKERAASGWMRKLSHPVQSAFSKLGELLSKKKKGREEKFAALIPSLTKNITTLSESSPPPETPKRKPPQPQGPRPKPQTSI